MEEQKDEYLVGVLSDTHGRLSESVYAALAECDHIIHAGDIGGPDILHQLEALAPVSAVLGNNDIPEYGERVGRFAKPVIGGVPFLVSHYPQDVKIGALGNSAVAPGDPIPQVCIHGHTHVPELLTGADASPAEYYLCPGAVFRPRGGSHRSIVKLRIAGGRVEKLWFEEVS